MVKYVLLKCIFVVKLKYVETHFYQKCLIKKLFFLSFLLRAEASFTAFDCASIELFYFCPMSMIKENVY